MAFIISWLDGTVLSTSENLGAGTYWMTVSFADVKANGCILSYTNQWQYRTDLAKFGDSSNSTVGQMQTAAHRSGLDTPQNITVSHQQSLDLAKALTNSDDPSTLDVDFGLFGGHHPTAFYNFAILFREPQAAPQRGPLTRIVTVPRLGTEISIPLGVSTTRRKIRKAQ